MKPFPPPPLEAESNPARKWKDEVSKRLSRTPRVFVDAGAPTITVEGPGDIYVDTSGSKIYISSESTWLILN